MYMSCIVVRHCTVCGWEGWQQVVGSSVGSQHRSVSGQLTIVHEFRRLNLNLSRL